MIAALPRTVLKLSGASAREWLDGLLTNSVQTDRVTFAALLTPQGKIIADMFVTPRIDGLLIDTPEHMGAELKKRLTMYKLREPITIEDVSETYQVHAIWGDEVEDDLPTGTHPDPRHPTLGWRVVAQTLLPGKGIANYDAHRLALGVPDSQFDFTTGEAFPADACMDELNGVDYKKGCFIGQEVVSRMHRMSTVKKRMRGLVLSGDAQKGDPVQSGARRVGDVLHVHGKMGPNKMGMALIRLERVAAATEGFTLNGAPVEIMDGPNG